MVSPSYPHRDRHSGQRKISFLTSSIEKFVTSIALDERYNRTKHRRYIFISTFVNRVQYRYRFKCAVTQQKYGLKNVSRHAIYWWVNIVNWWRGVTIFYEKIETFDLLWLVDSLQYCIIYASYKNHMFLWLEYNEEVAVQQKANACVRIYFYAH